MIKTFDFCYLFSSSVFGEKTDINDAWRVFIDNVFTAYFPYVQISHSVS